ncbi:MAG TPA: 2-amino-4-hydroxy-6-hydroxymethyldihydropteridine diphosphokinase [Terriglobales bacterium]|nr:2-amino-4-hydroxy-6-hydroxymethyldihydropteridine diphosphokinase [Terriglobales bacterium]
MTVYLSLGSNRGEKRAHLARALAALPAAGLQVRAVSRIRATRPRSATGRALFLNCVVKAETRLLPHTLLRRLRRIESALGRHRGHSASRGPRTPRTVDIDIVAYSGTRVATRDLTLPHPRYREREFVLTSLAELGAWELMRGLPRRQYRPSVSLERLGLR